MNDANTWKIIGRFHSAARYPYDAPRQPDCHSANKGIIQLTPGQNYEQALEALADFSHIWVLFLFDQVTHCKMKVMPPRGEKKVGIFACRTPHRINRIGMSAVKLEGICGCSLTLGDSDLLDQTPILDIKPYIPYSDSIPEATSGWLTPYLNRPEWHLSYSARFLEKCAFFAQNHVMEPLIPFLNEQLRFDPFNGKRRRISASGSNGYCLAYRTWRIFLHADQAARRLFIDNIAGAYTAEELDENAPDPHADKALHRAFCTRFPE